MPLHELLKHITHDKLPDHLASQIVRTVVNDSRHIVSGCVFLAIRGISSHALSYLSTEQCELATAIIYEPDFDLSPFVGYEDKFIAIDNLHRYVGAIAKQFYQPQFVSPLIGVTGTNGKTSVTQFLSQLADYAFIGTMGYGRGHEVTALAHTTPDALLTQEILSELSTSVPGVAMEVSSHAMAQHRVDAVDFEVAVFTNLSQDHLDFHKDMKSYFNAKAKLFRKDSVKTAVINTDDNDGFRLAEQCQDAGKRVIAYGNNVRCRRFDESVQIRDIALSQQGISADLDLRLKSTQATATLLSPVWGTFNVYNLLAAILALYATGKDIHILLSNAQRLTGVTGRIEAIDLGDRKTAVIDYAHTPDALASTLRSLREHMHAHAEQFETNQGQIYTVFGCGGDRDKGKRPLMAEAVNNYSDFGIITDDNPRTESSQAIIDDILTGNIEQVRFQVIPSRRVAIEFGLSRLSPNDVLLIAGKGHEDYQIIGTEKTPFSDHDVVKEWLR